MIRLAAKMEERTMDQDQQKQTAYRVAELLCVMCLWPLVFTLCGGFRLLALALEMSEPTASEAAQRAISDWMARPLLFGFAIGATFLAWLGLYYGARWLVLRAWRRWRSGHAERRASVSTIG